MTTINPPIPVHVRGAKRQEEEMDGVRYRDLPRWRRDRAANAAAGVPEADDPVARWIRVGERMLRGFDSIRH